MKTKRGYTVEDLIKQMGDSGEIEKTASAPMEKKADINKIAETLEIYNLGKTFGVGFADGLQEQMQKLAEAEAVPEPAAVPPAMAPTVAAPGTVDAPHPTLAPTAQGVDSQAVAPQQIATQPQIDEIVDTAQLLIALKSMTPAQIVQLASGMSKEELLEVTQDPEVANIIEGAMKQIVGVPNPAVSNAVAGQ